MTYTRTISRPGPGPVQGTAIQRLAPVPGRPATRDDEARLAPERVWQATLGELQLQMDSGTFSRWFNGTRALRLTHGILCVAVPNEYVKDWLDHRLRGTIDRTMAYLHGEMTVEFVVVPR